MKLVLTHAKFQILETIRVPVAVLGNTFFPAAAMLFFVVPFAGDDPAAATFATGAMVVFAVMASCLFTLGIGVAEDRVQPWEPFSRSLPAGPFPRFAGRILNVLLMAAIALLPVLIIAATLTAASVSALGLLLGAGAVAVAAFPFMLLGLAIGYSLPSKAAIAVAQVLFFPMAVAGGLFFGPPGRAPEFIQIIAPYVPTRGGVELVWAATTDFSVSATSLIAMLGWVVAAGAVAIWAYRRDEGRRFT